MISQALMTAQSQQLFGPWRRQERMEVLKKFPSFITLGSLDHHRVMEKFRLEGTAGGL